LEGEAAAAGDQKEGWLGWMSVYFVHLAGCTTLDIGCNEVFHVWPPGMGLYELDGFCNSGMFSGF